MSLIVRFMCCDKKNVWHKNFKEERLYLTHSFSDGGGRGMETQSIWRHGGQETKKTCMCSRPPILPSLFYPGLYLEDNARPPHTSWFSPLSPLRNSLRHSMGLIFNTTDNNKTMIRRAPGCLYICKRHTAPSESAGPFVGSPYVFQNSFPLCGDPVVDLQGLDVRTQTPKS